MIRALLAAGAGCLLACGFPAPDLGVVAWIALAPPIVLGLTSRGTARAAGEGFVFALVAHAAGFAWWHRLLVRYGGLSSPEAAGIFLLLAAYLALYGALFLVALRRLAARRGLADALLLAPVLWAALEHLRGRLLTGFPWSPLGASQHRFPIVIQAADLGGVTLVSLAVACGSAAAAWGLLRLARSRGAPVDPGSWRVPAAILAVPALALGYGAVRLGQTFPAAGTLRAGLVQGNVPQDEKWEPEARQRILAAHLEASRRAAAAGARLIVWPESSVPLPLTSHPAYHALLADLARETGADLLVGSVHWEDRGGPAERVYNSAFLIPGGAGAASEQRYDKMHLVPYGEYVPLKRWLGPVGKLVQEASDFTPGDAPRVLEGAGARLAPLVCFEAIFPDLVRRFTVGGAEILVNVTNDGFLGDTAGPRQHLALAAIRAVENRRWLLRAANTGISAVVDEKGRVVRSAPYGTAAEIVVDVPRIRARTLYARTGDVLGWGCVILALASLMAPGLRDGGTAWTTNCSDDSPP